MARRIARECTIEEFDAWSAATDKFAAVGKAADEEGGPSLSLVPRTEREEVCPTDLLPPAAPERADAAERRAGREAARTAGRRGAKRARSTQRDDGPATEPVLPEGEAGPPPSRPSAPPPSTASSWRTAASASPAGAPIGSGCS